MRASFINFLKNFTLVLGTLAVIFLGTELALRIFHPLEFRVQGAKIKLPVNRKYIFQNDKIKGIDEQIVHTKNSLGFRGENPPANFSDYLTLIAVGGSTTECYYLSDNKTWVDLLGGKLKKVFRNLWINNAGLDGQSSFGNIVLMEDYITRMKPKVVLFLVGANDIGLGDPNQFDAKLFGAGFQKWAGKSEVLSYALNFCRAFKASRMGVYHQSLDWAHAPQTALDDHQAVRVIEEQKHKYLQPYEKRLQTLIGISQKNGIEPVFITQPSILGNVTDDVTGVNLARIKCGDLDGKTFWEVLELYNDVLRSVAARNNILLIDLAKELKKNSRFYYDYFHFNYEGSHQVAALIDERLRPFLQQKYPDYLKPAASDNMRSISGGWHP